MIFGDELKTALQSPSKMVHFYASSEGYKVIDPPKLFEEMVCPFCNNPEGVTFFLGDGKYAWMCKLICSASKLPNEPSHAKTPPKVHKALQWPLFCEMNGIGDLHHNVSFGLIRQSPEIIKCLRAFAENPKGVFLMRGESSTGKTYACLGLSELFTVNSSSIRFFTHKSLSDAWIISVKERVDTGFINKLKAVSMLIIDDFGISDPSKAFMTFFMDIVDYRMQWRNKGTIITTNLSMKKLSSVCGDALSLRITTGEILIFSGPSRR